MLARTSSLLASGNTKLIIADSMASSPSATAWPSVRPAQRHKTTGVGGWRLCCARQHTLHPCLCWAGSLCVRNAAGFCSGTPCVYLTLCMPADTLGHSPCGRTRTTQRVSGPQTGLTHAQRRDAVHCQVERVRQLALRPLHHAVLGQRGVTRVFKPVHLNLNILPADNRQWA